MGRRPHALIQEFFDRGPKLADNSNRYQHTCKRCGEFFPKGRIDGLTTHLLRRCSNLSPPDRTWVFQQLQSTLDKPNKSAKRTHAQANEGPEVPGEVEYQSELPPAFTHQQPSALETLAEVSGQHSSRHDARDAIVPSPQRPHSTANTVAEAVAEQALLAQLQAQNEVPHSLPANVQPATEIHSHPQDLPATRQGMPSNMESDGMSAQMSASSLAQAAAAAGQQLDQEQGNHQFMTSNFPPSNGHNLESFNIPIDMGYRLNEPAPAPDLSWTQPPAHNPMTSFGDLSMPPSDPMAGYGILSSSTKHKPRGRFNDIRRKEVGEIRKQGACLRCRMLKKPCSGDTPCKTCATVESARIWKGKCVRTRLSEEMPLWSTNVFGSRAQAKLSSRQDAFESDGRPGDIYVSLFGKTEPLALSAKKLDNTAPENGQQPQATEARVSTWSLQASDKLGAKLGAYIRRHVDRMIEVQCHLMQDILRRVHALSQETSQKEGSKDRNDLQRNVLELWALTELLTSGGRIQLHLSAPDPATEASRSETTGSPQTLGLDSQSYSIIRAQLLAAAESRCSKLSKSVLNELEGRLLQRQQTSRFATLLSALVLLNAVECMTGHLQSCETNEKSTGQLDSETEPRVPDMRRNDASLEPQANPPGAEPTGSAPKASSFWTRGPQFADLLTTLLRMRALPPRTKILPEANLKSLRDFAMPPPPPQPGEALSKNKLDEESKEAAADWLDALDLEAEPLRKKRDTEGEDMEAWSLKFVAGILLPEAGR